MYNSVERYVKYKNYIITIVIESYSTWREDDKELFDKYNARYQIEEFVIKKIEDISTKLNFNEILYTTISGVEHLLEVNKSYTKIYLHYFYSYERAFIEDFIKDKQYLLFPNGYSGYFKEYEYNGRLLKEFYHTNGIIDGVYTEYYDNGKIICNYTNNKKNGEFKKYYPNEKIHIITHYKNDLLDGTYMVYNKNGLLTYEAKYDNNILQNYNTYHPFSGDFIEKKSILQ